MASECGWHGFKTKVSDESAELRDSSPERQLLFYMLEVYWDKGDGHTPPVFIQRAAKLCGYPLTEAGPVDRHEDERSK